MNRASFEYFGRFVWLVGCLILLIHVAPPPGNAQSSADEMYQKALQLHLQFKDQQSLRLLRDLLRKHPGHARARRLFEEMGGNASSLASGTGTSARTPSRQSVSRSRPSSDQSSTGSATTLSGPDRAVPPRANTSRERSSPDRPRKDASVDSGSENTTSMENPSDAPSIRSASTGTGASSTGSSSRSMPALRTGPDQSTRSKGSSTAGDSPAPDRGISPQPPPDRNGSSNPSSDQPALQETTPAPNLNQASTEDLEAVLEGTEAQSVIEDRNKNGYYLSWNDFQNRTGLSASSLGRLRSRYRMEIPVININTTTSKELRRLPYIDQNLAENVIDFRFTYGRYSSLDELMDVPGFTESILNNVRAYLRVS